MKRAIAYARKSHNATRHHSDPVSCSTWRFTRLLGQCTSVTHPRRLAGKKLARNTWPATKQTACNNEPQRLGEFITLLLCACSIDVVDNRQRASTRWWRATSSRYLTKNIKTWRDHWFKLMNVTEQRFPVVLFITLHKVVRWNFRVWPFKWKLLSSTFLSYFSL